MALRLIQLKPIVMLVMCHFKESMMKKLILAVTVVLLTTTAYSAVRCVPSGGGTCCWDTDRDGPFKPIGC
jgi:hypothetical protein